MKTKRTLTKIWTAALMCMAVLLLFIGVFRPTGVAIADWKDDYDTSKFYGKRIFSNYIANNYLSINFEQFRPLLDIIDQTIVNYHNLEKTIEESK